MKKKQMDRELKLIVAFVVVAIIGSMVVGVRVGGHIHQHGLKSIVECVWEGGCGEDAP